MRKGSLLAIFLCLFSSNFALQQNDCSNECVLYNEYYKNEFLYAGMSVTAAQSGIRDVYAGYSFTSVYDFDFTDLEKTSVWIFEPTVKNKSSSSACYSDTFYLKNSEYNEYLYASDLHFSFLKSRRKVYTWSRNSVDLNDEKFKWKLKKIDHEKETYLLVNQKNKEPLYAAIFLFNKNTDSRRVFTWYSKPDGRKFNWIIKCRKQKDF
jgi:hypothetical protein